MDDFINWLLKNGHLSAEEFSAAHAYIEAVYNDMCSNKKQPDHTGRTPRPYEGWGYLCDIKTHAQFCNCTPEARGEK